MTVEIKTIAAPFTALLLMLAAGCKSDCMEKSLDECGRAAGCRIIQGEKIVSECAKRVATPLGCMDTDTDCDDALTLARDNSEALWQLPSSCIPSGWTPVQRSTYPECEDTPACADRSQTYSVNTTFEAGPEVGDTIAECAPTCGELDRYDGFLSISALPAGDCSSSETACDMAALTPCECPQGKAGVVSSFRCQCESGSWKCRNVAAGAGVCPPCE
jgi:hypothetical protein